MNCEFVLKKEGEVIPVGVKYGEVDKKGIKKFLQKFKIKKGIVVSKDVFAQEASLKIIPLWQFLLTTAPFGVLESNSTEG